MLRQTVRAFTFPRTRAAIWQPRRRGVLLWWPAATVALVVCASLRGYADDLGFPVHGAEVEEGLLGFLPTKWLQQSVYPLWPWFFQWASVVAHVSWFPVPWIAALLVSWRRPERIGSFFRWWITLHAVVVIAFALFPLEPPWMADAGMTRIVALTLGDEVNDPNPLAAMPSLHVALPLLISFWFFCERWKAPGLAMLIYSGIVGLEVVFSGEHYVVDLIGSGIVALAIALVARLDIRRLLSGLKDFLERKAAAGRADRPRPVPVPVHQIEKGQALIEMALVLPLIFVFILVMVDFGIAIDRREVLQHAVREGARYGSVGRDIDGIKARVEAQSEGLLDDAGDQDGDGKDDIVVCYADGPDANTSVGDAGDDVRVTGDFTYKFSVGGGEMLTFFGAGVPSIEMNASADMRLENSAEVPAGAEC